MGRRRVLAVAAVLAFAAAGGGAYAATQSGTNPRQAFINDLAQRLHVSPSQLNSAIKGALIDRLNAAVKAGQLTAAQANAIESRIDKGGVPPFFFGPGMGPGRGFAGPHPFFGGPGQFGGPMSGAAAYLGMSETQLFSDIRSGKSLAQIAKAHGKSVSGLETAMLSAIKTRLNQAVAAKRLTKSQEQQLLSNFASQLHAMINRSGPASRTTVAPWGPQAHRWHSFGGPTPPSNFSAPAAPAPPGV